MKRELEALLFATDTPLSVSRLKSIFPRAEAKELRGVLKELALEYDEQEHAFMLVEFGGGWQIASRPEFSPLIEKLMRGRRFTRLSKPALEVLAIVAYRQPLTRMEIEEIRGVQCGGVLSTLTERSLVTVVGRAETVGHPLLYGTTRELLNYLGLKGLSQLPKLPDLESLIDDRDALKKFAGQLGEELSDQELADYAQESEAGEEAEVELESEEAIAEEAEAEIVPAEEPAEDAAQVDEQVGS